ncbi:MAG: hypothetical protein WC333_01320 [Dehalococcoidia bacterium]|jgi:hypothetical protein
MKKQQKDTKAMLFENMVKLNPDFKLNEAFMGGVFTDVTNDLTKPNVFNSYDDAVKGLRELVAKKGYELDDRALFKYTSTQQDISEVDIPLLKDGRVTGKSVTINLMKLGQRGQLRHDGNYRLDILKMQ